MQKKVSLISLGCDKNRVDAEKMLYLVKSAGYSLCDDLSGSEIIIVNTCAFIKDASEEAINAILEVAEFKKTGKCEKLVVAGCFASKHSNDVFHDLHEVDAFVGTNSFGNIVHVLKKLYDTDERIISNEAINNVAIKGRIQTTPLHYAHLKISDGCDNHCTFCTIPQIKGGFRSEKLSNLIDETKGLIDNGVKELIIVGQDVTSYGKDFGSYQLLKLLDELTKLDLTWIRLMYCYPELVTKDLIKAIDENKKIAKYIDIPMQHSHDDILRKMNRQSNRKNLEQLLFELKSTKNKIAVRSTFITGFPSETEKHFEDLYDFIKEHSIEHVGIFSYSKEEGTPAYSMKGHLSEKIKNERANALRELHFKNSFKNNEHYIGKTFKVLYEDIDYERNLFVGRTEFNAPEIDTNVLFSAPEVEVGTFYEVKITGLSEEGYDLMGEISE
ncbi:MAG: 30S ribosomal protein S12 methylthiotransferase RimO [Firmicutes bacterium]|nr:30S ribosomal protein S12 methylthiotransferase RimO [Bacillota bacterium]MCL2256310.1 30S ribosomal protein S12 methylthiotransferase RimO [Bacillota bacterium]